MRLPVLPSVIILLSLFAGGCAHRVSTVSPAPDSEPDPSFPSREVRTAVDFPLQAPSYRVYDLSKLRIGMTRAEVLSLFSRPRNTKRTPKDEYWEYDQFELYFRDGRLLNWFDL